MGNNGFVTEKAHLNVDQEKYSRGYDAVFGKKREKTLIEKLSDEIANNHQITSHRASQILETISKELNKEIDSGELAEQILNLSK